MKTSDFYYDLPEELIAQDPLTDRSSSRLMVMDRNTGAVTHRHFRDITQFLRPGDCLVINNTRVIPARLLGTRLPRTAGGSAQKQAAAETREQSPAAEIQEQSPAAGAQGKNSAADLQKGGAAEILLLKRLSDTDWECLVRPGKRLRPGDRVTFGDGRLTAEIMEIGEEGNRIVRFHYEGIFEEILDALGEMPLPPYITHKLQDKNRYQTVYAKHDGSAAAPTAGLHFTPELLDEIRAMGVHVAEVTLHVGLGTFRPVKVENVLEHHMHSEYYRIEADQAALINGTKRAGGRIICVGTTSCRTLESAAGEDGMLQACSGWTDIFIYPGYRFKIMDGLITNFHLPESTLIMLVSAFAGKEHVLGAYKEAVRERYRFFSFGDAMFIH